MKKQKGRKNISGSRTNNFLDNLLKTRGVLVLVENALEFPTRRTAVEVLTKGGGSR